MFAENRGFKQYAEDSGGDGIPLLCLPAFPFDGTMFQNQRELAKAARLILPDYRGTGQCALPADPAASLYVLADDMFALLDRLNLPRVVVLGVSMGGYLALAMAAQLSHRIRGLILADTRPEADDPEAVERRRQTAEGLRSEGVSILRERVVALVGKTTFRQQPVLVERLQAGISRMPAEGLARLALGLASRPSRIELLPRLHMPTLVIAGGEDTVSPPEVMRRMAGKIPGADFQVIPQAGHLSPLEQPQAFNNLVRKFMQSLPKESNSMKS